MRDRRGEEQEEDGERREKGRKEGDTWGARRMYGRQEREGTGKGRGKEEEGARGKRDMGDTENV